MPSSFSYYDHAVMLLKNRPHSSKELRDKLLNLARKRQYRNQTRRKLGNQPGFVFQNESTLQDELKEIDNAIQTLQNQYIINDSTFAMWYCDNTTLFNPKSKRALTNELLMKGIHPSIIDTVLRECPEEANCKTVALKKSSTMPKEKLVTYLYRKGFQMDTIRNVLKEISNDEKTF